MSLPISADDPFGQSTSGTTSFRLLTHDLVKEAYAYCGMTLDTDGEQMTTAYLKEGKRSLNAMIKTWQAQGIHLWTYTEGFLFLESGVNSYTLEQVRATNYYLETTTTTDITSTDTEVDFESVSELDEDYWFGIMDSDNNLVWRQVESVSGSTVEADSAFGVDIDAGATVYYYESAIRPCERVLDVRRITLGGVNNETPIKFESHQHFFRLPDKSATGSVSEAHYDRQLSEGVLWIWATPSNSSEQIRFTYERKLESFVDNDDCPDFPDYWIEAMTFGLAKRLAIKYGIKSNRREDVKEMAEETLNQALTFDNANYDIEISINGS